MSRGVKWSIAVLVAIVVGLGVALAVVASDDNGSSTSTAVELGLHDHLDGDHYSAAAPDHHLDRDLHHHEHHEHDADHHDDRRQRRDARSLTVWSAVRLGRLVRRFAVATEVREGVGNRLRGLRVPEPPRQQATLDSSQREPRCGVPPLGPGPCRRAPRSSVRSRRAARPRPPAPRRRPRRPRACARRPRRTPRASSSSSLESEPARFRTTTSVPARRRSETRDRDPQPEVVVLGLVEARVEAAGALDRARAAPSARRRCSCPTPARPPGPAGSSSEPVTYPAGGQIAAPDPCRRPRPRPAPRPRAWARPMPGVRSQDLLHRLQISRASAGRRCRGRSEYVPRRAPSRRSRGARPGVLLADHADPRIVLGEPAASSSGVASRGSVVDRDQLEARIGLGAAPSGSPARSSPPRCRRGRSPCASGQAPSPLRSGSSGRPSSSGPGRDGPAAAPGRASSPAV